MSATKVTDITTANIDQGQMPRNQSRVKFEMVSHLPDPPKKRGSILGKIFKTVGAFSPAGFFFPPFGTIGALSGLGLGQVGAKMDYKQSLPDAVTAAPPLSYPGISSAPAGYQGAPISSASFASDPVLNLVTTRDQALSSSAKEVK